MRYCRRLLLDPGNIRYRHDRAVFLAISTNAFTEVSGRCLQPGISGFVVKPTEPQGLYETVARWVPQVGGDETHADDSVGREIGTGHDPQLTIFQANRGARQARPTGRSRAAMMRAMPQSREVAHTGSRAAVVFAGVGAVLFSAKAIVVKLCYRHGADAETVLALRMIFSLPFFWSAVWWQRALRRPAPIEAKDIARMVFLGFMGYYVSSYLDFLSLQYISVGLERIILYLNPTLVLVISAVALKKRIDPRQWLAMGIAYAGVTLVFLQDIHLGGPKAALGSALVFTAAFTYAIYLIFSGEMVHRVGSIRLVAYASGSATFFCVAQSLLKNPQALIGQPPAVYGLSLINASLCTFVPMLLIMTAVKRVGSGLASQSGVIGPVATVLLGWYFLGESIGLLQVVGVAVVLVSMGLLVATARART